MSDAHAVPLPRPSVDGDAAPFWRALADGELRLQHCASCGAVRHPPRPACARCGSRAVEWVASPGTGEVWSFTVVHPPTLPAFAASAPYVSVVVRLDEGVFMVSQLVDATPDEVAVGRRVALVLDRVDGEYVRPLFAFI